MTTDQSLPETHAHSTTAIDKAIADLTARVAKLEAGTLPPVQPPVSGTPVPSTIDSTGATDVSAKLITFLLGLPQGSTAVFPATGIYRVDSAIKLGGRVNLTLEGQGCTIKAGGTGFNENYSLFYFQTFPGTNAGIKIHGFKLVGNSPTPGTFISGKEGQHGVLIDGGTNFEVWGCDISNTYGDGVEVNSNASGVKVHDNTFNNIGRNAVSVICGSGVEVYANQIPKTGYCIFDVEPNANAQPCFNLGFHDNTAGSWGNAFFALDGSQTGAVFHDITVDRNTITGKSLLTVVTGPGRKQRIVFTNNKGQGTATASFTHVDQLVVTGNTGVTVGVTDCPGAVTSPNP